MTNSDESYVIDLCDRLLSLKSHMIRGTNNPRHVFDWEQGFRGDFHYTKKDIAASQATAS
jgi:hypothetical protein